LEGCEHSLHTVLNADYPPRLGPAYLRWLIEFLRASRKSKFEPGAAALVHLCNASVDLREALARGSPAFASFERHGLLAVSENLAPFDAAEPIVIGE